MITMIFADWDVPSMDEIELFADCSVSGVILGVSNSSTRPTLNYTKEKWIDAARHIADCDMAVNYMAWAIPKVDAMMETMDILVGLDDEQPADALWLNAEKTWHNGSKDAVEQCTARLEEISKNDMPALAVVGFDKPHPHVVTLSRACSVICPEAYSFWKVGEDHWSHSFWTFPGVQQRRAFEAWKPALLDGGKKRELIMGLSIYDGARPPSGKYFPGCTGAQSRRWAISETVAILKEYGEFGGVAYWSGKHVLKNEERQGFLRFVRELSWS